jgi:NaMN:DMB phosphoribosyltransferase
MPAIANLTIADGQGTPVNHTFTVVTTDGSKGYWADKVSGVPVGYSKLNIETRQAQSTTGAHSVLINYELPATAVIDGVTTRVRVSSVALRFNFAQDSTDQERKDAVAYAINILSNATAKAAIYNIEPWY